MSYNTKTTGSIARRRRNRTDDSSLSVRVRASTRWALKIAGARIDCSIMELLARVEHGDAQALAAWVAAAKEVDGK